MRKDDVIVLATAIRMAYDDDRNDGPRYQAGVETVAQYIANELYVASRLFDRAKFLEACGMAGIGFAVPNNPDD